MEEAEQLVEEIKDLLIEKGCTVNKLAMLELAIYIIEREKKSIEGLRG